MKLRYVTISLCLAVAVCCRCGPAEATLGESADSIAKDREAFSGTARKSVARAFYRVQEIISGTTSTTIREYVSPSGVVFAVAWSGLVRPDLKVLLGSHHDAYRKALARRPRQPGHREMKIKSDGLVVETWGHMRDLHGRAYLPDLLPEGVSLDEIR